MKNLFNFQKPKNIVQWLIFLAAIGITLSSPQGTRAFIRELQKQIIDHGKKTKSALVPGQLSRVIYYLKKRKLIKVQEKDGKTTLVLTGDGKKRKLQYDLEEIKIPIQGQWDKKWRLLMFDIPESEREAREALRNKLKDLGFLQFQKSVWVYPYPCEDEIDFIAENFSVAPFLTLLTVKIEHDKPLRTHFKLF